MLLTYRTGTYWLRVISSLGQLLYCLSSTQCSAVEANHHHHHHHHHRIYCQSAASGGIISPLVTTHDSSNCRRSCVASAPHASSF